MDESFTPRLPAAFALLPENCETCGRAPGTPRDHEQVSQTGRISGDGPVRLYGSDQCYIDEEWPAAAREIAPGNPGTQGRQRPVEAFHDLLDKIRIHRLSEAEGDKGRQRLPAHGGDVAGGNGGGPGAYLDRREEGGIEVFPFDLYIARDQQIAPFRGAEQGRVVADSDCPRRNLFADLPGDPLDHGELPDPGQSITSRLLHTSALRSAPVKLDASDDPLRRLLRIVPSADR